MWMYIICISITLYGKGLWREGGREEGNSYIIFSHCLPQPNHKLQSNSCLDNYLKEISYQVGKLPYKTRRPGKSPQAKSN